MSKAAGRGNCSHRYIQTQTIHNTARCRYAQCEGCRVAKCRDVALYALGVGSGAADPVDPHDLFFVYKHFFTAEFKVTNICIQSLVSYLACQRLSIGSKNQIGSLNTLDFQEQHVLMTWGVGSMYSVTGE